MSTNEVSKSAIKPITVHCCDNCQCRFSDDAIIPLEQVDDLNQRLDPGGTVPSGECSRCGCLVYIDETPLEQWYRVKAARAYQDDHTKIHDDAKVQLTDSGAWVQAWVWLSDIGLPKSSGNSH